MGPNFSIQQFSIYISSTMCNALVDLHYCVTHCAIVCTICTYNTICCLATVGRQHGVAGVSATWRGRWIAKVVQLLCRLLRSCWAQSLCCLLRSSKVAWCEEPYVR